VSGALRGAVSCSVCGATTPDVPGQCPLCGARLLQSAPGTALGRSSLLLGGITRAAPTRSRLALGLDLLPVMVAVALVLTQIFTDRVGGLPALVWTVALTAAYLVVQVVLLGVRGRTMGRLLLRLRTVDDLTGLPVGVVSVLTRLGVSLRTPRTVTADLARGRDPLDLALPRLRAGAWVSGPAAETSPFEAGRAGRPPQTEEADAVAIVFDTGRRQLVHASLLIGRSPEIKRLGDQGDVEHPLLAIADLSRTLAKTHALLEWSGSVLWVTDLHSAGGSVLVGPDGESRALVPGVRAAAAIGWTVRCGSRWFSVHSAQGLTGSGQVA